MSIATETLTDTLNQTWKNDKSRFGYRMLQKMGWKEDKGLGKDESGNVSHIKVKKREEGLGIGMEKVTDHAGNLGWGSTATTFDAVLQALKQAYRPDDDSSDKKKKKKSDKKEKKKRDKGSSSSSTIISVGIKYRKMSSAKSLKDKSEVDMRAILGVASSSRPASNETESRSDFSILSDNDSMGASASDISKEVSLSTKVVTETSKSKDSKKRKKVSDDRPADEKSDARKKQKKDKKDSPL